MSFTTTITIERDLPWWNRWRTGDDYQEIEVEVCGSYAAGSPMSMGNPLRGDMGHPEEPAEIEAEDAFSEQKLIVPFLWIFGRERDLEFCDLLDCEVEEAEMNVYENPPECDDYWPEEPEDDWDERGEPDPDYHPHQFDNRNQHDPSL